MLGVAVVVAALMPANVNADDQQIADFVKSRLQTEQQRGNLRGFNVDMRVDKGTVWFKGFVANRDQELLILRTAQTAGHLGVVQVVDDIELNGAPAAQQQQQMQAPVPMPLPAPSVAKAPMPAPNFHANEDLQASQVAYQQPLLRANPLAGSGFQQQQPAPPFSSPIPQQSAQVWQQQAPPAYTAPTQPQGMIQPRMPTMGYQQQQMPVSQRPLAFASAKSSCVGQDCYSGDSYGYGSPVGGGYGESYGVGTPVAIGGGGPGGGGGGAGALGGSPNLPGYAWPGYAASSNYSAVSYPQQYSPSAWPYIGPFYPYPQVPLGWRKVSLEWDDGWWFLDFNDKSQ